MEQNLSAMRFTAREHKSRYESRLNDFIALLETIDRLRLQGTVEGTGTVVKSMALAAESCFDAIEKTGVYGSYFEALMQYYSEEQRLLSVSLLFDWRDSVHRFADRRAYFVGEEILRLASCQESFMKDHTRLIATGRSIIALWSRMDPSKWGGGLMQIIEPKLRKDLTDAIFLLERTHLHGLANAAADLGAAEARIEALGSAIFDMVTPVSRRDSAVKQAIATKNVVDLLAAMYAVIVAHHYKAQTTYDLMGRPLNYADLRSSIDDLVRLLTSLRSHTKELGIVQPIFDSSMGSLATVAERDLRELDEILVKIGEEIGGLLGSEMEKQWVLRA